MTTRAPGGAAGGSTATANPVLFAYRAAAIRSGRRLASRRTSAARSDGGYKEDGGFAINGGKGFSKVIFTNHNIDINGPMAIAMGSYVFTCATTAMSPCRAPLLQRCADGGAHLPASFVRAVRHAAAATKEKKVEEKEEAAPVAEEAKEEEKEEEKKRKKSEKPEGDPGAQRLNQEPCSMREELGRASGRDSRAPFPASQSSASTILGSDTACCLIPVSAPT